MKRGGIRIPPRNPPFVATPGGALKFFIGAGGATPALPATRCLT
jgi:hypothetical protein